MSVIDFIGTQAWDFIGLAGGFLFAVSYGFLDARHEYRNNLRINYPPPAWVKTKKGFRPVIHLEAYALDRIDWNRACFVAIFITVLFSIL